MRRLFGTDGIRGVANHFPMTVEMAVAVGRAVAISFAGKQNAGLATVLIGKDTRESGDMLESAVSAGICSMGMDATLAGVMPTPGLAYLTVLQQAYAGIVISASHNPYMDNGIKIFDGQGYKLSLSRENDLEAEIFSFLEKADSVKKHSSSTGRIIRLADGESCYAEFLNNAGKIFPDADRGDWDGTKDLKLVLDCANGATAVVARKLFPQATILSDLPDGKNINDQCGSEHPEALCRQVVNEKAIVGFAFDGDGDRVIAVDETGDILSGDRILCICAEYLKTHGLLRNNTVVSTIMSNAGLSRALRDRGINHVTTDVGDRHVLEKIITCGACLGGEDSGHIIFSEYQTTGDGLLTALILCHVIARTRKPLSALATCMIVFPQKIVNVAVRDKPDLLSLESVQKEIRTVESIIGHSGRVLVRYSGTQPLCRVMVEAASADQAQKSAERIADSIRSVIGTGA